MRATPCDLFWSRRGEVACPEHAPQQGSTRWTTENWQPLHAPGRRLRYQCQHCKHTPIEGGREEGSPTPLVLNVDDHGPTRYVRHRTLTDRGFTVADASTGQEALTFAQTTRPDLILLDVRLPDVDGRDLCQRLKADPAFGKTPVLLISAALRGREVSGAALQWTHADGFITEPVEADLLAATLHRAIKSRNGRRSFRGHAADGPAG